MSYLISDSFLVTRQGNTIQSVTATTEQPDYHIQNVAMIGEWDKHIHVSVAITIAE